MTEVNDPHSDLFVQIPARILLRRDLPRVSQLVWALVYSWLELGRAKLSVRKIAAYLGTSRSRVRGSLRTLEAKGLVEVVHGSEGGREFARIRPIWPESMREVKVPKALRKRTFLELSEDEIEETRGGTVAVHPPGPRRSTYKSTRKEELSSKEESSSNTRADIPRAPVEKTPRSKSGSPPVAESPAVEIEDLPQDLDSPAARRRREEILSARSQRRETRERPVRTRRPPSSPEFLERPSERWEWNAWREKPSDAWNGQDVLGYWACRFREVVGIEDPDLFVPTLSDVAATKLMRNGASVLRHQLSGDSSKWRTVVDRFLADSRRETKRLVMILTPSNPRTVLDLLDGHRRRNGREEAIDVNARSGADREGWIAILNGA